MNHEDLEREFEIYSAMITIQETFQEIYEIMGVEALGKVVTDTISSVKLLTKIAVETHHVDLQKAILDLENRILEIRNSLLDVDKENFAFKQENWELKKENESLKEQIKQLKENPQTLTLKGKFYYKQDDERPFCPFCYDSTQKISLLTEVPYQEQSAFGYRYKCTVCKTTHTA